jgi:phosphoribosylanthranilate isomerase
MSVLVKICGITNVEDARWAVNLGAEFIGLNFVAESPRKVSLDKAAEIVSGLPAFVKAVGVFVNPTVKDLEKILKKVPLRILQLHGNETKDQILEIKERFQLPVWKAVRVKDASSLEDIAALKGTIDMVLLDTFSPVETGGTGKTFDWNLAVKAKECGIPLILSGGLNPDNVQTAKKQVGPYALDVASGVEKEGHPRKKDIEKMKQFVLKAKS